MNQPDAAAQINISRERLNAASGALNALAADANRETLRNTASAVGSTLIATAGDDVLWGVLSPEQPAGNLNAVERAQLRTVLTTNWVQTLEDLKYVPPPPTDTYGTSFVQALGSLVNRDGGGDVAAIRQKVRELGQQLVALAALPPAKAPPSRLRKFLNRTKRVIRGLAVVAGVAVATVAISQVIMPASAATAIAAAVVPLLPGHLITTSVVAEMVIEVTKKAVEFTLDSALKRLPGDAPGDQDPEQAVAQYAGLHLNSVALPQLGNLAVEWSNVGAAKHADPPIEATRDLIGVTTMQIHVTAVATASIVSSPATINLADQLDGVLALLAALDCSLGDKPVDASYVSATLTEVKARIETAQTQFGQAVHP